MKIESNIPIPSRKASGTITETLRAMSVGDSVTFPSSKLNSYRSICVHIGQKVVARKISDTEHRIWRTA